MGRKTWRKDALEIGVCCKVVLKSILETWTEREGVE